MLVPEGGTCLESLYVFSGTVTHIYGTPSTLNPFPQRQEKGNRKYLEKEKGTYTCEMLNFKTSDPYVEPFSLVTYLRCSVPVSLAYLCLVNFAVNRRFW